MPHHKKQFIGSLAILIILLSVVLTAGFGGRVNVKAANIQATLVRTTDTSLWSPNSPDPSGIEYRASTNTLLISDGEVEEMPNYYQGKNLFEASLDCTLINSFDTTSFSKEPVGMTVNPANDHFFISDDNKKRVNE